MNRIAKNNSIKLTNIAQMRFRPNFVHSNKMNLDLLLKIDQFSPLIQNYIQPNIKRDILENMLQKQKDFSLSSKKLKQSFSLFGKSEKQREKIIEQSYKELKQYRTLNQKYTFKKISFIQRLNANLMFIGNQNQIDMIQSQINDSKQNGMELFTQYYWSLNFQQSLIKSISVTKQLKNQDRFLCLGFKNKIKLFTLYSKSLTQIPKLIFQINCNKEIIKVDFINKQHLLIYFIDSFQIHQISQIKQKNKIDLIAKTNYNLDNKQHYELFDISSIAQNTIKIFFILNNLGQDKSMFRLYYIVISFNESLKFQVSPIKKIYELKMKSKNQLRIHNYSKQMILVNLRYQIIIIKNGLIIDNAIVNIQDDTLFLKYFSLKQSIVHTQTNKVQEYHFHLSSQFNPQKIIITPKDSIQYTRPLNGQIFNIIDAQCGYNIFFKETKDSTFNVLKNQGQMRYWFCMSYQIKTSTKLQQIFPHAQVIQNYKMEQLQMICDTATKIGLSQKQAYLQIWKKSHKNTQKSYNVLMMINDIEIILSQLESMCRKSLKYRDMIKIIKQCIQPLKGNIYSINCSQKDIILYLKCNFLLLKLQTFKDVQLYRKKKNQQNLLTTTNYCLQLQNGNEDLKQLLTINKTFLPTQKKQALNINNKQKNLEALINKQDSTKLQNQNNSTSIPPHINNQNGNTLIIGIKAYRFYNDTNLKAIFLGEITEFLYNPSIGDHLAVLRYFIKNFRLLYRIFYQQLVVKTLVQHKYHIKELISNFPQFLPMTYINEQNNKQLQTIWKKVEKKDLTFHIFLPELQTIDNKQIIKSITQNLWVQRNIYTYHGLIYEDSNKILSFCNSQKQKQKVFYIFYLEMFQQRNRLQKIQQKIIQKKLLKDPQSGLNLKEIQLNQDKIKQAFDEVASFYPLIPQNLKHYSEIYYELYFHIGPTDPQIQKYSLLSFIQLSSYELFKIYFHKQKTIKGFILEIVYNLYQQKLYQGRKIFRKGLSEYFHEEKQTVLSDLKTILNRFNNKNWNYQMKNEKLFIVLVDSLAKIVTIGKHNKINLTEELLVYVRDVSFAKSNTNLIQKLRYLNRINQELPLLQEVDINMTIQDIECKGQIVLSKILDYMIQYWKIKNIKSYEIFRVFSYQICSHVNSYRAHIYFDHHKNFLFFYYVTEIIKQQSFVKWIIQLLQDQYLKEFFDVDQQFKQCVFFYAYNWRLSLENAIYKFKYHNNGYYKRSLQQIKLQNSKYLNHKYFIIQILQLLNKSILDRKFVQLQLEYAEYMQTLGCTVKYPISLTYSIPTLSQIQNHTQNCQKIMQITSGTVQKLFSILDRMREICQPNVTQKLQKKKIWFIRQIYDIIFFQLMKKKQIMQSVILVQSMLALSTNQDSIILYPILIIQLMVQILIERNKFIFIELIGYFFYQPVKLIAIIKYVLTTKMTAQQIYNYAEKEIKIIKQKGNKSYTTDNFLFKSEFINKINEKDISKQSYIFIQIKQSKERKTNQQIFSDILNNTFLHLIASKQDFKKNKIYRILFKIFCHSPYLAVKFIFSQVKSFNLKNFRAFLSFLVHQVVFNSKTILEFGICLHQIIIYRVLNNNAIEQIIKYYQKEKTPTPLNKVFSLNQQKKSDEILMKSLQSMKNKLQLYQQKNLDQKIKQSYMKLNKKFQRKQTLQKLRSLKSLSLSQSSSSHKRNIGNDQQTNENSLQKNQKKTSNDEEQDKINEKKYQKFDYNNIQEIFKDPTILLDIITSAYLFNDGDDGYNTTQDDQLNWVVDLNYSTNLQFNQQQKRHQIFQLKQNKRFGSDKVQCQRKLSNYLQKSFLPQKKSSSPHSSLNKKSSYGPSILVVPKNSLPSMNQSYKKKQKSFFGDFLGNQQEPISSAKRLRRKFTSIQIQESSPKYSPTLSLRRLSKKQSLKKIQVFLMKIVIFQILQFSKKMSNKSNKQISIKI